MSLVTMMKQKSRENACIAKGSVGMFNKGEFIIYGSAGACQVMDITTLDHEGIDKERLYYVLRPCQQGNGRIFTPTDNQKVSMRKVLSQEEAETLIDQIPDIESTWVNDNKSREKCYKESIRSSDCRELIKIIKMLYQRRAERLSQGKKFTSTDEKYMKMAEENLYSELSIPLNIPKNEMSAYIGKRVEGLKHKEE